MAQPLLLLGTSWSFIFLFSVYMACVSLPTSGEQIIRRFEFHVKYETMTRLCSTKTVPAVNGQVPGPSLYVREGDNVLVKVSNGLPDKNVTIHWHGIKQLRTGWADGPGYITQCPMKPGTSYTYNFTVTGQRGTLWWHAHIHWMRYTVYGAIIILPKKGNPYPFATPDREIPLILGEWWKGSMDALLQQADQSGGAPNVSDAYTINGQPGDLYPCSMAGTVVVPVKHGETYLLRIVNAAMNGELFVSVAGHKLTVVEVDAVYSKPLEVEYILITPGQTTNVLLKADQVAGGKYYLAARPYIAPNVTLDNTTATAIIAYEGSNSNMSLQAARPMLPKLPAINDSLSADSYSQRLRSLASAQFPAKVPLSIDRHLFFTIGLAIRPCANCTLGGRLAGVINNISFVLPETALLQAHIMKKPNVFITNFPDNPTATFNFTGQAPANMMAKVGTRLSYLPFNSTVQLILQDTSIVAPENHPIHLHGFNFFVVGLGSGNYNATSDPLSFNLVDPPERNTIGVPQGGWAALRFRADNPGVWFMHCHLEFHTSSGLETAFVVENGPNPEDKVVPPPVDLPPC